MSKEKETQYQKILRLGREQEEAIKNEEIAFDEWNLVMTNQTKIEVEAQRGAGKFSVDLMQADNWVEAEVRKQVDDYLETDFNKKLNGLNDSFNKAIIDYTKDCTMQRKDFSREEFKELRTRDSKEENINVEEDALVRETKQENILLAAEKYVKTHLDTLNKITENLIANNESSIKNIDFNEHKFIDELIQDLYKENDSQDILKNELIQDLYREDDFLHILQTVHEFEIAKIYDHEKTHLSDVKEQEQIKNFYPQVNDTFMEIVSDIIKEKAKLENDKIHEQKSKDFKKRLEEFKAKKSTKLTKKPAFSPLVKNPSIPPISSLEKEEIQSGTRPYSLLDEIGGDKTNFLGTMVEIDPGIFTHIFREDIPLTPVEPKQTTAQQAEVDNTPTTKLPAPTSPAPTLPVKQTQPTAQPKVAESTAKTPESNSDIGTSTVKTVIQPAPKPSVEPTNQPTAQSNFEALKAKFQNVAALGAAGPNNDKKSPSTVKPQIQPAPKTKVNVQGVVPTSKSEGPQPKADNNNHNVKDLMTNFGNTNVKPAIETAAYKPKVNPQVAAYPKSEGPQPKTQLLPLNNTTSESLKESSFNSSKTSFSQRLAEDILNNKQKTHTEKLDNLRKNGSKEPGIANN